jgi:hypothetical protein
MQYQAPDFGFIATAGRQAGEAVQGNAAAKEKERVTKKKEDELKMDEATFNQAYNSVITEIKNKYKEITGDPDEYNATRFASQIAMPKMKTETASQAAQRLMSMDTVLEKKLTELKEKTYYQKTKAGNVPYERSAIGKVETEAKPQGLESQTIATEQQGPPQPGQQMPAGRQYYSGETPVGRMQESVINEPPAQGTMATPAMGSQERRGLANEFGIAGREGIKSDIQLSEGQEIGQEYTGGQTAAGFLAGQAGEGRDIGTGSAAATIGGKLPTEQQLSQNELRKRQLDLKEAADNARARLRAWEVTLKGKQITADTKKDIEDSLVKARKAAADIDEESAKLKMQLERYTKPSYRGSEPEAVEKLVDQIEAFEKNRESLGKSVQGYEDILKGVTSNTLPPQKRPTIPGVENPAAKPKGDPLGIR